MPAQSNGATLTRNFISDASIQTMHYIVVEVLTGTRRSGRFLSCFVPYKLANCRWRNRFKTIVAIITDSAGVPIHPIRRQIGRIWIFLYVVAGFCTFHYFMARYQKYWKPAGRPIHPKLVKIGNDKPRKYISICTSCGPGSPSFKTPWTGSSLCLFCWRSLWLYRWFRCIFLW